MSRKRWKEIPEEHRNSIMSLLERSASFCQENGATKSARAYRAAHDALDVAVKPTSASW